MISQPQAASEPSSRQRVKNLSEVRISLRLDIHIVKKIFLACILFIPTAYAADNNDLSVPTSDRTCPPTFSFETPLDYIAPGAVLVYLTTIFILHKRAEIYYERLYRVSLGVMFLIGLLNLVLVLNCREFPSRVRATYVKQIVLGEFELY